MGVDSAVDIAAVVEDHPAQILHDPHGEADFGIKNEQLASADRHGDIHASCLAFENVAKGNDALWTGLVDRESSQRSAAARKEQLAGGHETAGKRSSEPQANAVGKNQRANRPIIGVLGKQLGEVRARSESRGSDSEIDGCEVAMMRIERLVTCIANERTRKC